MASDEKKRVINFLPDDLIFEVFVRLPVKSLLRFQSLSKSWRDMITSKTFIKRHLDKVRAERRSSILALVETGYVFEVRYTKIHSVRLDENFVGMDDLGLNFEGDHWYVEGTCHGLICSSSESSDIILLNPSTRTHKIIPLLPTEKRYADEFSYYMIGYASKVDDYKVVRIVAHIDGYHEGRMLFNDDEVHIYSLKTNSWKSGFQNFCKKHLDNAADTNSKFVEDDAVYMLSWPQGGNVKGVILRYDLDEEASTCISVPNYGDGHPNLEAIDNKLVFLVMGHRHLDLWALDRATAVSELWTKVMSMSLDEECPMPSLRDARSMTYFTDKFLIDDRDSHSLYWLDTSKRRMILIGELGDFDNQTVVCLSTLVDITCNLHTTSLKGVPDQVTLHGEGTDDIGLSQDSKLKLNLTISKQGADGRVITVMASDNVKVIRDSFVSLGLQITDEDFAFVHDGQRLDESMSFEAQSINNDDCIKVQSLHLVKDV